MVTAVAKANELAGGIPRRENQTDPCQYHLGEAPDPSQRVVPRGILGGDSYRHGSRSAFRLHSMDQVPLNELTLRHNAEHENEQHSNKHSERVIW